MISKSERGRLKEQLLVFSIALMAVAIADCCYSGESTTQQTIGKSWHNMATSFDGHDLLLSFSEITPEYHVIEGPTIRITSWYNEARVRKVNLLGDGRDFYFVEFEGMTGTGVHQTILAVFGWHEDKLAVVLLESLSFYFQGKFIQGQFDDNDLVVAYKIQHNSNNATAMEFKYKYTEIRSGKKTTKKWKDILFWDETAFSFYAKADVKEADNIDIPVRHRIMNARSAAARSLSNIRNLDYDILRDLGILDILPFEELFPGY